MKKLDLEIVMGPLATPVSQHFWFFLSSQTLWRKYVVMHKYRRQKYRHQKSLETMVLGAQWIGLGLLSVKVLFLKILIQFF